jgi:hypothetical protein
MPPRRLAACCPCRALAGAQSMISIAEADIVVICHHGVRSQQVAGFLERPGLRVQSTISAGGVDAWANATSIQRCTNIESELRKAMPVKFATSTLWLSCWPPRPLGSSRIRHRPAAAVSRCPELRRAVRRCTRHRGEAGREKEPQALAGLLPTIAATGNTFWNDTDYRVRSTQAGNRIATSTTATPMG